MLVLSRSLLLVLLMLFMVGFSVAGQQDDLYSVRVPVLDQSANARQQGLREGLRRVLVRITGDSQISVDRLPRSGAELDDYVSEYLYQTSADRENHEAGMELVARFVPATVEQLIRDLELPVWPTNRPRVLVWVVIDGAEAPAFVAASEVPELTASLKDTFDERAVLMRQPLLDLEDHFTFPPEDAWSMNVERLVMAAERYGASTSLLLRLVPPVDVTTADRRLVDEGQADPPPEADWSERAWSGDWLLLSEGEVYTDTLDDAVLTALVTQGVHEGLDVLARRHAYRPSDDQFGIRVQITDVLTFEDFKRAEGLIVSMEMVRKVKLLSVLRDWVEFELEVEGSQDILLQSFRNSEHFSAVPVVSEAQELGFGSALRFSWVP